MAIVAEQIELESNRDTTTLRLSNVEKFGDASGYRCNLKVHSSGFACERQFYFDDDSLAEAIVSLRRMANGQPGEATVKDRYEYDFLRFAMNRLGHVVVSGALHEYGELSQSLEFAFRTDQTVLAALIRELTAIHEAMV